VALAGPAVNVLIALGLWLWLAQMTLFAPQAALHLDDGSFIQRLLAVNVMLAGFNLLPAFPMDGGRVLRAALAIRMDHARATEIAASVGQALALGLGLLGLLYNPFLLFIALFVWIGAAAEAGSAQVKSTLAGLSVGDAMVTDFKVLTPDESLEHAVALTLAGSQKDFPVMAGPDIVGVLTQSDLLKGLQRQGEHARIYDWMQREVERAEIDEPLESVLERLRNCPCRLLVVTSVGHLKGIVNLDNFSELLQIQLALKGHGPAKPSRTA